MINLQELVTAFKAHPGIGFIAFSYENKQKEISKRLVNIGISYDNALKKDLETLNEGVKYVSSEKYTEAEWNFAIAELKESAIKSLNPNNTDSRSIAQREAYINICTGLRWHIESKTLHIFGSSVRKTITEDGVYKEVKSSGKTIAKNVIKQEYLRSSKLRTFIVGNLTGDLKINGNTIEIETLPVLQGA